ncbi:nickel-dependent hydrogenase large subunit [Thiocystis violacea]|uniref:nickel-dependent hydrogenase large subunit n=1 Tax=Thiocystis violacea TaxID=13725 RepID=UPI00190504DD|nr:nickel-dependent hydrogenase large subunit [Thiocystis violacea]MBK1721227.1 hypothetical protein [Thiocystis violacea]
MSDPAGRLKIQLRRGREGLLCDIQSTRPVKAAATFAGRSASQTAAMLPMLYSICAKAQAFACVGALESATGMHAPASVWRMRHLTVKLETIREHLWRMLLDWPRMADATPEQDGMSAILQRVSQLFALIDPQGCLFRPGTREATCDERALSLAIAELEVLVSELVFGCPADAWIHRTADRSSLAAWAEGAVTRPARLLRAVQRSDTAAVGQSDVAALPEMDQGRLIERLLTPDYEDFLAQPSWDEAPRETSPFTRNRHTELLQALSGALGNGLLPRLTAQLLDVARLTAEIRQGQPRDAEPPTASTVLPPSIGLGRVEAARGRLVHLVRLDGARVLDYRILAPTEWNFHPRGSLAKGLAALPVTDDRHVRHLAELLIMATDPCVAYDLSLANVAADAGAGP